MNDNFIKELLKLKQSRVYSLIVGNYYNEIITLKPTLFRIWFCNKIGIEIDIINISSLKSALLREKKKLNSQPILTVQSVNKSIESGKTNKDQNDFKFSNPDEVLPVTKKRITGY